MKQFSNHTLLQFLPFGLAIVSCLSIQLLWRALRSYTDEVSSKASEDNDQPPQRQSSRQDDHELMMMHQQDRLQAQANVQLAQRIVNGEAIT